MVIVNAGGLLKMAGTGDSLTLGSLTLNGGAINLQGTSKFTGNVTISAGTYTINKALQIAGYLWFPPGGTGTLTTNNQVQVNGNATFSSGSLVANNVVQFAGLFTQTGGTITINNNMLISSNKSSITGGTLTGSGKCDTHC